MTNQATSTPSYLSDKEVAQRYSIGRATVWRWAKTQPSFPRPIKLAGCTRWKLDDLIIWECQQQGVEISYTTQDAA